MLLTRSTKLLVKSETEYGTDPVPTPAANALAVRNVDLRPVGDPMERDFYRDDLSPMEFVRGEKYWQLSFETELVGTGTAGQLPTVGWVGPLLKSCCMTETLTAGKVTYAVATLAPTSQPSCTIYLYKGPGLFRKLTGCRGTWTLLGEVGKYGFWRFEMYGLWNTPTDADTTAPILSTVKAPTIVSAGFTIGGYAAVAERIEFALNNEIAQRRDMNAATGLLGHVVSGRQPGGSFDPEASLEAVHPFWGKWASAEAMALNWGPIGATAGNRITVTGPKVQYADLSDNERNGVFSYDAGFRMARSAGDDEIKVEFT